jgi:hypothetical protein
MMAVVLAPFLLACWIAFDDPLFSISDRTRWYRENLSLPAAVPMNPLIFLWSQVSEQPANYLDTALGGLLTYPLTYKWSGFDPWLPGLGTSIEILAIVGLFAFVWSPQGRFILLALFASLVPYIFTWRVPNFGLVHHFRYTLHAYPIQLIAAALVLVTAAQLLWSLTSRARPSPIRFDRPAIVKSLATVGLIGAVWLGLTSLPYLRMKEDLNAGRSAIVLAGAWDRMFFRTGWYPPLTRGNVTARFSKGRKAVVWVPMAPGRDHRLVLRLDPFVFVDSPPQLLGVDVNGQRLAVLALEWERSRVGEYVVEVPAELGRGGLTRVELTASYSTRVESVQRISSTELMPSFHELVADNTELSFMLWAVVVEPEADSGTAD